MSDLLTTTQTLEALEAFRAVVRDFANREETLNREDRNLTEAAELRFQMLAWRVGRTPRCCLVGLGHLVFSAH